MEKRSLQYITEKVSTEFLPYVRKAGRYIGGEINQVKKDLSQCDLLIGLCFPDVYEIAMSNSAIGILYHILNGVDVMAAERVFSPWVDAEEVIRGKGIPLFSLESRVAIADFDVLGFSLTNELCYTNVLNMLDLGKIALRASDRGEDDPIILGGGGMTNCCEPVAPFFDIFLVGEAEDVILPLMEHIRQCRKNETSKQEMLLSAARKFNCVYVPSLYEFQYDGQTISSIKPLYEEIPARIQNAIVTDFDNAPVPDKPIIPFVEAVHERVSIEIMRGCPGRCRFCQASYSRRPIRYRSVERICDISKTQYQATGFETVSLLSLSTADYPQLEELTKKLHEYFAPLHVGVSLPSLRVDQQLKLLPQMVSSVRKGGMTIAVEAASEKVREIINKPLKDSDLFSAVKAAYEAGWQKFKLYFMVGLPGETEEDIRRIVHLTVELARLRKQVDGKTGTINAAISWFVPKPHTPLGLVAQRDKEYFENARRIILIEKKNLGVKFVTFKFHDIEGSLLESAIGRGDRRVADVIETAWRNGAKFDLWDEMFKLEIWEKAFELHGLDIQTSARREFSTDEILPWQHLGGPDKDYLLGHLHEARLAQQQA